MIEQHVLTSDSVEQPFAPGQLWSHYRQVGAIFQVRAFYAGEFHQAGQIQGAVQGVHLERLQFQIAGQYIANPLRHVAVNFKSNDRAPVAHFNLSLHAGEQVGGFIVLDFQVCIPGDAERVGGHHVDAGEEHVQIGGHYFFDVHEIIGLRFAPYFGVNLKIVFVWQADQARRHVGDFDARESFTSMWIAHNHSQIETQIGNVRERVGRIEGQGRQRWKNLPRKITAQPSFLMMPQIGHAQNRDTALTKFWGQFLVPAVEGPFKMPEQCFPNGCQLLQRGPAVRWCLQDPAGYLATEAGDADHEKFVKVGGENGQELDALEEWIVGVQGLFENPPIEL